MIAETSAVNPLSLCYSGVKPDGLRRVSCLVKW